VTDATDRLVVDLNQEGVRSLAVPESVTVDRSFTIELRNHGGATHVHLHLDDALSTAARLSNANVHVPGESRRRVQVHVFDPEDDGAYEAIQGQLKVAIGYGQETRFVDLTVDRSSHEPVAVDPELAEPGEAGGGGPTAGGTAAPGAETVPPGQARVRRWLPAGALGIVAVVLAAAALLSAGAPDLLLGGLAVVAGALAAGYLVLS